MSASFSAAATADEKSALLHAPAVDAADDGAQQQVGYNNRGGGGGGGATSLTLRSTVALAATGMLLLACVVGAEYRYVSGLNQAEAEAVVDPMTEVYERTDAWKDKQTCSSCSIVLPSATYEGKGLGPAIDKADCVVRFNAHQPDTGGMKPEDWGTKDDIRVINGACSACDSPRE